MTEREKRRKIERKKYGLRDRAKTIRFLKIMMTVRIGKGSRLAYAEKRLPP